MPKPVQHEWRNTPRNPAMLKRAVEMIGRRRRQMLIHSYIYYVLDDNVISDETWTLWAQQLRRLHSKYGKQVGFFDKLFADWNGSTGHHLSMVRDPNIERVARQLLQSYRNGEGDILLTKRTLALMAQQASQSI